MTQITLSVEELKELVQTAVRDALLELMQEDFQSEPRFTAEIKARLLRHKQHPPETLLADDVVKELGLDV